MSDMDQTEEVEEDLLTLHNGDHINSVRNYNDRMHFEFVSKDNLNINLFMNNYNKKSYITTPNIPQGTRKLIRAQYQHVLYVQYFSP